MEAVVRYSPSLAVIVVTVGVLGYAVALVLAAFFPEALDGRGRQLASWIVKSPTLNLGLPCAAAAAFAIVAALLTVFPINGENGHLELKLFGLEFSGPSGPITLWLMCFLGFVFALKLLQAK